MERELDRSSDDPWGTDLECAARHLAALDHIAELSQSARANTKTTHRESTVSRRLVQQTVCAAQGALSAVVRSEPQEIQDQALATQHFNDLSGFEK